MRTLAIATALVSLTAAPASAQFRPGPVGGPRAVAVSGGFSFFNSGNPRFGLSFSGSRLGISSYAVYPYGGFYGAASAWGWPPPLLAPPLLPPPPPVVVIQPIIIPVQAVENNDNPKVPDLNRFIVVTPDRPNVAAARPAPAPPVGKIERKPKEVADLGIAPEAFPLARGPAADPLREGDRLLDAGRVSFAKEEYGRALENFRRATIVVPDQPTGWFLLAQAQFAVRKYDDAVASMLAGLQRKPDWPASPFRIRDLYRLNPAAFDLHLQQLRDVLASDPNDPRLLFVLGVQLWFDDRRDEARPLLDRAAKLAKDPAPIELFLRK